MRNAAMPLFVLLCSLPSVGQNQPQWKLVYSVILSRQTAPISSTTIFTPEEAGVYRVTAFMSATAKQEQSNTSWNFAFECIEGVGQSCGSYMTVEDDQQSAAVPSCAFSPQVGYPVAYYVEASDPPPVESTYNLGLTIEQLQ